MPRREPLIVRPPTLLSLMEDSKVKVGDVLTDNDPRNPGRTLKVKSVGAMRAMCESAPGRYVYVLLTRIHSDGKPRRSGFDRKR